METLLVIFAGIFGGIVGSFLNVVIFRYNTGKGLGGRSMCMACCKTLSWYELLPLISFILQRGRCRSCGAKIDSQYFIVEAITAITFALVPLVYNFNSFSFVPAVLFAFIAISLLMIITVYDIKHLIMPNVFVYAFIAISFVQLFMPILTGGSIWFATPSWQQLLAGVLLPLPFLILWLISKGRWIGFGDIKFMIGIGWLLGLAQGGTAVIFSFWIGTLWIIGVYLFHVLKGLLSTRRLVQINLQRIIGKEIPFAPFLILATYIVFISRFDLLVFLIGS